MRLSLTMFVYDTALLSFHGRNLSMVYMTEMYSLL